jgi:hypothetical protein
MDKNAQTTTSDDIEITNVNMCNKPGCTNEGKLRCPQCVKYKIKEKSYFCSKACFTSYWAVHKNIHEDCN